VRPLAERYLDQLRARLQGLGSTCGCFLMLSSGGLTHVAEAKRAPVQLLESGPAAGALAGAWFGRAAGLERVLAFDMGGTTAKLALVDDGAPLVAYGFEAARTKRFLRGSGLPIQIATIELMEIGAGGGSIAQIDAGGSLRVGPDSAGADPGPACYGRGESCTVTDADLVAGRLDAANFLGGQMKLYPDRAEQAVARLAREMKTSPIAAARGIIRVVNANMERAIRVITVERGYNPRDFALLAFGGAGPMHACELALDLGIRRIVMPRNPGLLCAWGASSAPMGREYSITVRATNPNYRGLLARAAERAPLRARSRVSRDRAAEADRAMIPWLRSGAARAWEPIRSLVRRARSGPAAAQSEARLGRRPRTDRGGTARRAAGGAHRRRQ